MPQQCSDVTADVTALHQVADVARPWGDLVIGAAGAELPQELGFEPAEAVFSPGWANIAAMVADDCGVLWLIDAAGRLWRYDHDTRRVESPRCQCLLAAPRGLALTADTVIVSHGAAATAVTALARANGQILWTWNAAGRDLGDVVVVSKTLLWVLDRAGRIVALDLRSGAVIADTPTPGPARRLARGLDGKLYLLGGAVWRAANATSSWQSFSLNTLTVGAQLAAISADADGMIMLGEAVGEEPQVIHRLTPEGAVATPLVGYLGAALQLVWSRSRRLFVLAKDNAVIPLQPQARYARLGVFELAVFDATRQGVRWHKLVLDADIPAGTKISIVYRADDTLAGLTTRPWSAPVENFSDALIEAQGRYLALRGEFSTTHPLYTPRLRRVTAVLPRRSYLRYLPAFYQEDAAGAAFLERYLSLFETLDARLDAAIAATPALADPAAVPEEFLSWLSEWLAFSLEESWSVALQRRFMAEAVWLYCTRGTRAGLLRAVELLTGQAPVVFESFQLECATDPAVRADYARVFGAEGCHYCMVIAPEIAAQAGMMTMIDRLIEDYTPAHVLSGVTGLRPWFRLGMPTLLEINTRLTQPNITLETSVLGGGETVLIDRGEGGQVERKSRVGMDAALR